MSELPQRLQFVIDDLVAGAERDLARRYRERAFRPRSLAVLGAALVLGSTVALAAIPGAPLNQLFQEQAAPDNPSLARLGFLSGSTDWPPGTNGQLRREDFTDLGIRDATPVADGMTLLRCNLPSGSGAATCDPAVVSTKGAPQIIPAGTHWFRTNPRPDRPGDPPMAVFFPSRALLVELSPGAALYTQTPAP